MKKQLKLNLGCGGTHLDGYINIDIVNENHCADEIADCTDLLIKHPEWEGKVNEILLMHVVEHFTKDDATHALKDYCALLSTTGKLIMELPDFEALCRLVLEGNIGDLTLCYIFGSHSREGQVHHWGWTQRSLRWELLKAGFNEVTIMPPTDYHAQERPCFRVEASK